MGILLTYVLVGHGPNNILDDVVGLEGQRQPIARDRVRHKEQGQDPADAHAQGVLQALQLESLR